MSLPDLVDWQPRRTLRVRTARFLAILTAGLARALPGA